jgi:hypothetical protein
MLDPRLVLAGTLAAIVAVATAAEAQPFPLGTAFTYQGRLEDAGTPANGTYDMQFTLHDAAAAGAQVGPVVTRDDVAVAAGLFTVALDFDTAFAGQARFLEIGVRPGSSTGGYTLLGPRQELTPAPNALFSSAAPWAGISGMPAGFADGVDDDSGGDITGVTTAAGSGLTGGGVSGALSLAVAANGIRMNHTSAPIGSVTGSVVAANGSNLIYVGSPFTPDSNGSCLVVVQASTVGSGETSTNTSVSAVARENGVDLGGFGSIQHPVFSPFSASGVYEATAVGVLSVVSGRSYQLGCHVFATDTFVGNLFVCMTSYVCQ